MILNACFTNPRALQNVAALVGPTADIFYTQQHQLIWTELYEQFQSEPDLDHATVTLGLKEKGDLEKAGGVITTWSGESAGGGGDIVAAGDPRVHESAVKLLGG